MKNNSKLTYTADYGGDFPTTSFVITFLLLSIIGAGIIIGVAYLIFSLAVV